MFKQQYCNSFNVCIQNMMSKLQNKKNKQNMDSIMRYGYHRQYNTELINFNHCWNIMKRRRNIWKELTLRNCLFTFARQHQITTCRRSQMYTMNTLFGTTQQKSSIWFVHNFFQHDDQDIDQEPFFSKKNECSISTWMQNSMSIWIWN